MNINLNSNDCIRKYDNNIDFIATSLFYKNKERGLDKIVKDLENNENSIFILNQFILDLETEYDYILFDCPPSNNILTQNSFE